MRGRSGRQAPQSFVGQGREFVLVLRAVGRPLGGGAVRSPLRPASAERDWWVRLRQEQK